MSKKTTLYVPDKIEAILNAFGIENSLSGSVATIIERYDRITRDACPELTEAEWMAFVDVHNGCGVFISAGGHDQAPSSWANIADSEPDGLNEKWGISCLELAQKLKDLPLAGRIAVWDVAARFWANPRINDISARENLLAAGARIAETCPDCGRPKHKFHNCEINQVANPVADI